MKISIIDSSILKISDIGKDILKKFKKGKVYKEYIITIIRTDNTDRLSHPMKIIGSFETAKGADEGAIKFLKTKGIDEDVIVISKLNDEYPLTTFHRTAIDKIHKVSENDVLTFGFKINIREGFNIRKCLRCGRKFKSYPEKSKLYCNNCKQI